MMKNIKSSYFIKIIFDYLNEKIKLKIVKYNKALKDIIDIQLLNYKLFTGKYLIYETNGIGKEYDNNNDGLLFEGEYKNGERNGKGKEYNIYNTYQHILFEGEYKNGKRNGRGKQYNIYGKLIYEGEYLNGKRWNGKGFDENENILYELIDGRGNVEELINQFIKFEGEYKNGERNGKGKEYNIYKDILFEGEYFYGKRWNGKGFDEKKNILYELKDGKGYVKELISPFSSREPIYRNLFLEDTPKGRIPSIKYSKFEGEFKNGERNGEGKEYNGDDELLFEGEYSNNKKNGKGKEYGKYGSLIFQGDYLYDSKIKGKAYYLNGNLEYEGEYLYDKKYNGKGYDENGNIKYELKNGNGNVKEYNKGFLKFEGEYKNGKRNGKGKEYDYDGVLVFEGDYKNGKRNGKGKYSYLNGQLIFEGEYLDGMEWNIKGNKKNIIKMAN